MENYIRLSNFFSLVLCLGLVVGCTETSSPSDAKAATPADKKEENSPFQKVYNFKGLEGCETHEQKFTASTTESIEQRYCDGLEDGERNNYCAESERLDAFLKDCVSRKWAPRVKGDFFFSESPYDLTPTGGENLYKSLLALRATSFLPAAEISSTQYKQAVLAYEKFKSCGFNFKCFNDLHEVDTALFYKQVRWQPENVDVLIITVGIGVVSSFPGQFTRNPEPNFFVLIKKSLEDSGTISAEIWTARQPKGFRSYKEFFNHPTSTKILANLTVE